MPSAATICTRCDGESSPKVGSGNDVFCYPKQNWMRSARKREAIPTSPPDAELREVGEWAGYKICPYCREIDNRDLHLSKKRSMLYVYRHYYSHDNAA